MTIKKLKVINLSGLKIDRTSLMGWKYFSFDSPEVFSLDIEILMFEQTSKNTSTPNFKKNSMKSFRIKVLL